MQKIKMSRGTLLTFEEGCNKYLENCRQRNLREGTINHYRQSYLYFYKFFDPKMPIEDIDEQTYKDYVLHLKKTLNNDISINSYLRDLITTIHFFMNEGWLPHFKMQAIKVDKSHIETYTDIELQTLLKKPNVKKCNFTEYQSWVMTNFLFATGVRQRSLINIKIKDLDFDNNVVYVNVTKNRKPLIVPLNQTTVSENISNSSLELAVKTTDFLLVKFVIGFAVLIKVIVLFSSALEVPNKTYPFILPETFSSAAFPKPVTKLVHCVDISSLSSAILSQETLVFSPSYSCTVSRGDI